MLHIQLLGDFQLTDNNAVVTALNQTRLQSLLAYLLLHRHAPQSRQHLAFLFWPDSSEAQARANLRQLLHYLHHALPNAQHFLLSDNKRVQWNQAAPYRLDVADFEELLAQADAAEKTGEQSAVSTTLATAVDLYHGDLLSACYDDWILPERERWRERFTIVLEKLLLLLEVQRNYDQAIPYAQRLLRHDPLHESTYRHLMRLYALNSERASALHTYHTCVSVLQRELGVEPHPTTQEDYARLLNASAAPLALATPMPRPALGVALVGRQAEWAALQRAWQQANHVGTHFVLIAGEGGIGKSRLAEELWHWVTQQGILAARTRSYAAEGDLAYAPVIEWLRSPALQPALHVQDAVWRSEAARLLPELLVQQPTLPRPEPLDERRQRQRLFEALARIVLTAQPPLLLLIDDLQWCDQETLAWLHYLLRFDLRARLLVVGTVRPEEVNAQHPLTTLLLNLRNSARVTEIELRAFTAEEVALLAAQLTEPALTALTLTARDLTQLYQASEGNPLFVVEMVRAGLQSRHGATTFALPTLPPKVQALIQARLQQLSPLARDLAGLAATSGRAFTFALLAKAGDLPDAALLQGLDELWQRRIIREQGANAYDFSHDRIRETAYATLSPVQRPILHWRVAQALEELYVADLDAVSAQLAVHYEQAGMVEQAIPYYQRAAEVAEKVFSYTNALTYLDAGLRLIKGQPRTAQNRKQEVMLLSAKALHLSVVRGFAVAEIAGICTELAALLPYLEDDQFAFQAHLRLRGFYAASGAIALAYDHTNHLLALAERLADPVYQVGAWQGAGGINLQLGHFAVARHYMEQGSALYRKSAPNLNPRTLEDLSGNGISSNLMLTLWLLGYPDQARAQMPEALAIAERSGNPLRMSIPPFFASMVYCYMRDVAATATAAEKQLALDAQYGVPLSRASGLVAQGWVWAQQGRYSAGIAQMRAGIDEIKAANHTMFQTHRLAWLVEAQMQASNWATATATLDEAFAMSDKSGQHSCDAELYRLRGEWWVHVPVKSSESTVAEQESAAEVVFWQAIEVARSQEAKSFELRAVMSLCHLWQRQGKRAEARQLLAEVYGWFTEGFDTADLQAAAVLLAEFA